MNRKSVLSAAIALALGGGLAVVAATPASALASCGKYACVWGDEDFKTNGTNGSQLGWDAYIPNMTQWNYSGTTRNTNDDADSGVNRGSWDPIRLYKDVSHGGTYRVIQPQKDDTNFHNTSGITDWHDVTSSVYFESEL